MKSIVIFDEYQAMDLRPADLLKKYIQLTEQDVTSLLIKGRRLQDCPCPACREPGSEPAFTKFGLQYVECPRCRTMYVNPRPSDGDLDEYQSRSGARKFWIDELSKKTTGKRKEKIIKPRFQWILDSTEEHFPQAAHFADVNTNQYGYIEEMSQSSMFTRKTLIQPMLTLDRLRMNSGIRIFPGPVRKAPFDADVDVISLFEVADRTADMDALFEKIGGMLKKNGLCFMTAVLSSGFDLQILREHAENLFPPDRLNVFSVEGLKALFARHEFECLELSTPGIFDVEAVSKALQQNPKIEIPGFVEYLLKNRSKDIRSSFQQFLQAGLLSSYGRIVLRKK